MSDSITPTKVCTKCHGEFPATTDFFYKDNKQTTLKTACKTCLCAKSREYAVANPQNTRERKSKWQKSNPERKRATSQKYRLNNLQKIADKNRIYNAKNKEKNLERNRRWMAENREYMREKGRVYDNRRRARKLQFPDTFTNQEWLNCLEYFHYTCAVCGNQLRDLFGNIEPHADHWIPLSHPDCTGTIAANMVCLCSNCNLSKKDKVAITWLIEKYGKRKAREVEKRVMDYFSSLC